MKKKIFLSMLTGLFITAGSVFAEPYSKSELYLDKNGIYMKALYENQIISESKEGLYHPESNVKNEDIVELFYSMIKNSKNFSIEKLKNIYQNDIEKMKIIEILENLEKNSTDDKNKDENPKQNEDLNDFENIPVGKEEPHTHTHTHTHTHNLNVSGDNTKNQNLKNESDIKKNQDSKEKNDLKKTELKKQDSEKENTDKKAQEDKKIKIQKANLLMQLNILPPEDISTFDLKKEISKGEFCKYLEKILETYKKIDINKQSELKDIKNTKYEKEIKILLGNKIMYPDDNENFNPDRILSKGDVSRYIAYVLNLKTEKLPPLNIHYKVLNVPYVSQIYPVYAPIGCEPTCVYSALRYKGYAKNTTHRQFLNQMPYDQTDPRKGFVGSPFAGFQNYSKRETIFPNALADYAKKYGNAIDISGSTVEEIQKELMLDNPVVAYLTFDLEEPVFRNYNVNGQTYRWLRNNHVVVVCGYDPKADNYYVSDPWNKYNTNKQRKYWVNGKKFKRIYDARRHAISIR